MLTGSSATIRLGRGISARDRGPLQLATRELVGVLAAHVAVLQADRGKRLFHRVDGGVLAELRDARGRLVQVRVDRAVAAEGLERVLKDRLHGAQKLGLRRLLPRPGYHPIVDDRRARRRLDQPQDGLGQRGLPAARLAHQADDHRLVALDGQVHVVQGVNAHAAREAAQPVHLVQILGLQNGRHWATSSSFSAPSTSSLSFGALSAISLSFGACSSVSFSCGTCSA